MRKKTWKERDEGFTTEHRVASSYAAGGKTTKNLTTLELEHLHGNLLACKCNSCLTLAPEKACYIVSNFARRQIGKLIKARRELAFQNVWIKIQTQKHKATRKLDDVLEPKLHKTVCSHPQSKTAALIGLHIENIRTTNTKTTTTERHGTVAAVTGAASPSAPAPRSARSR